MNIDNEILRTETAYYYGYELYRQQILSSHISLLVIPELVDILLGVNREFQLEGDELYNS